MFIGYPLFELRQSAFLAQTDISNRSMATHKFSTVSIDWLMNTPSDKSVFDPSSSFQHIAYPLAPELGEVSGEMICTRDGVSLYSARHRYVKNQADRYLQLGQIQIQFPQESLYIEIETGTVIHRDEFPRAEFKICAGEAAFYHAREIRFVPFHDTHSHFRTWAISLPIAQLQEMFGAANVAEFLNALEIQQAPSVKVAPIPPSFARTLEKAFSTQMTGQIREIQIQSNVLEFLCLVIQHYTKQPNACEVSPEKHMAIRKLHDQLLQLNGKLPTLAELARQIGLSQGELSKFFMDEYGLSVHRFIQRQRLIESHETVQATLIPLKRLADRLGYSNVTHFNAAFKKQFGYPPGSLRKGRRQATS